ncbi:MAG: MBL fold metallo-hydrolase [Frankiales bacterium]|nr:MBL fold metallo-hydrolase [Frankiales bacterium]
MRLTSDVCLVGGGPTFGFGLTPGTDAHVYLLDGGDEAALVDCGMGSDASFDQLVRNVRGDGVDPDSVTRLFITHYHADHCAGASRYRHALGLEVLTGHDTADALEAADHRATSYDASRALGVYPADSSFPPCAVDTRLGDGDEVRVGRLSVTFVATPGHCAGHGSYVVSGGDRTYLLSGDALFAGGRLLLQATRDCDLQRSFASVRTLAALDVDSLLPGHGPVALTGGRDHARAALATIDALGVPASLV